MMVYNPLSSYLLEQPILILLLIAHFLSDFQLQNQQMADGKKKKIAALVQHLILVLIPLVLLAFIFPLQNWDLFAKIWASHAAIDSIKYCLTKKGIIKPAFEKAAFVLDQVLHLACILIIYQDTGSNLPTDSLLLQLPGLAQLLIQVLFILVVTKPVNIVFKLFFSNYQPKEGAEAPKTKAGAGALIGQLERLIMAIFLLFGQFAAIGLVFTAKSIARFDRISKDQSFAEYYLIGSLFSIISVLIVYALLVL